MKKINHWMFTFLLLASVQSRAQESAADFPKVGDPMPDHTFTDIENYSENSLKISDFKGKWLILDLWSMGCGKCIASFPKMNKLDQQYAGMAKVVMVGIYSDYEGNGPEKAKALKDIFERRAKRYNLKFTSVYDSLVLEKYDIGAVPAIFVINPQGVIAAKITTLDSVMLAGIMNGRIPERYRSYSAHERHEDTEYTVTMPLLTDGRVVNGGSDTAFLFRSVLARWNPMMAQYVIYGWGDEELRFSGEWDHGNRAEAIGVDLPELFRIAYTGKASWGIDDSLYNVVSNKLILQVKDTLIFNRNRVFGRNAQNAYGYSLIMPDELRFRDPSERRKLLLDDLHRYFGLSSHIEKRKVGVYKLVVIDKNKVSKLKTKGAGNAIKQAKLSHVAEDYAGQLEPTVILRGNNNFGWKIYNCPVEKFIQRIGINQGLNAEYGFDFEAVPPILDETGIDFKIDLVYDGDVTDWNDNLEVLRKNGLDIKKGEAVMKCIVVNDEK